MVRSLNPARAPLWEFPTPCVRSPELQDLLGCGSLYVKRDDLIGYSWGGNKVRAIEFLIADILKCRADTVILCGGVTSNFAALMSAACTQRGLQVHQVSYGEPPVRIPAAMVAGQGFGTNYHFTGLQDRASTETMAVQLEQRLTQDGRRPYLLPRGGATPIGAMGYAYAAAELTSQLRSMGIERATVVVPVGSGGTIAGLIAGWKRGPFKEDDPAIDLVGVCVSRPPLEMSSTVQEIAQACPYRSSEPGQVPIRLSYRIVEGRGGGFGTVDEDDAAWIRMVEETGMHVDATYNAKALKWMRSAATELKGTVVYWHTGGVFGVIDRLCEGICAGTSKELQK